MLHWLCSEVPPKIQQVIAFPPTPGPQDPSGPRTLWPGHLSPFFLLSLEIVLSDSRPPVTLFRPKAIWDLIGTQRLQPRALSCHSVLPTGL